MKYWVALKHPQTMKTMKQSDAKTLFPHKDGGIIAFWPRRSCLRTHRTNAGMMKMTITVKERDVDVTKL